MWLLRGPSGTISQRTQGVRGYTLTAIRGLPERRAICGEFTGEYGAVVPLGTTAWVATAARGATGWCWRRASVSPFPRTIL